MGTVSEVASQELLLRIKLRAKLRISWRDKVLSLVVNTILVVLLEFWEAVVRRVEINMARVEIGEWEEVELEGTLTLQRRRLQTFGLKSPDMGVLADLGIATSIIGQVTWPMRLMALAEVAVAPTRFLLGPC